MKTTVTMVRQMGAFEVYQRTSDGFFNATALISQWNDLVNKNDKGSLKELDSFFKKKSTKEFINALDLEEGINTAKSQYLKTRGKNGGTWMSPLLFIDFAMWLNPSFKVKVLRFVYDELIKNRHHAGDNYNVLSSAVSQLKDVNYALIGQALNWIVFNTHAKNLRQSATDEQLADMAKLEENYAFSIEKGYIKTFDQLIIELRKEWHNRHDPF